MINAKLVTCGLCQSYYADPRQIPCSHSFCFDCIVGRLNEETLTLICPKCFKQHQYTSLEEFHERCMRDGFLGNLVSQFKKNRVRSSTNSSTLSSRPPSSISVNSPACASTPISNVFSQLLSQTNTTTNLDPSSSGRSTPSISIRTRPSSVVSQAPSISTTTTAKRTFFAKCQSCNVKDELIVCDHCENVICVKCANEHQSVVNTDIRAQWESCKTKYQTINDQSMRFDREQDEAVQYAKNLQTWISRQSEKVIQTLESQKSRYIDLMDKHRQNVKQSFAQEQVIDEYESIDKRVGDLLKSNEISTDNVNDLLYEIEHLDKRLNHLDQCLDSNELKFPVLSHGQNIDLTTIFGSLEFTPDKSSMSNSDPYIVTNNNNHHSDHSSTRSDDEDNTLNHHDLSRDERFNHHHQQQQTARDPPPTKPTVISSAPASSSTVPTSKASKKRLLWQIDYYSVPYYVRTYGNQLFICDKYGSLAIYKFNKNNDKRQKPSLALEVKLFKETTLTSTSEDDQTIIDSFVVYKLWIIVFKRKRNELHGTIYLFSHDGKLIPNGKCPHNYPSRELTIDTEINLLWSLDQKHLALFYYKLPETKVTNPDECFQDRVSHVQFSKPYAPIHISVNKNVLAVLDKNRPSIHVYDKTSKQQLYEHINMYHQSTHVCWDMALFSDNSLLIKLDETSTLKNGPSKHIYLQLDPANSNNVVGMIEEIDAYGMMITSNDEIFIGVRINTKGIVKCYV